MKSIKDILLKSLRETLDQEEEQQLNEWLAENPAHRSLLEELNNSRSVAKSLDILQQFSPAKAWSRISGEPEKEPGKLLVLVRRWSVAAVFILLVGLAYFIWQSNTNTSATKVISAASIDPGKDGARLKLSDGRTLLIDSLADGLIAEDGQVKVYKKNGQIVYEGRTDEMVYNEIVTDNGRQWSAQLPDGSTVWLNAASSLRYPLQFKGKERLVAMTGEASFNVVHNDQQPFRVKVRDQLVEDIGTEFNINAYNNETAIVTTVIEGVASVQHGLQKVTVTAGKQASETNGALTVAQADIDKAIAWRKGVFYVDGMDIRAFGRQLERWYNIEVVYAEGLPSYTLGGYTYRNNNLQEVLKVLELSGVKFKLEAGERTRVAKLVVLP